VYFSLNGITVAATLNIPKARIRGIEAGGSIEPSDWLELGGFVSYTDASYVKGNVSYPILGINVTYGPYGATPEFTSTAYLRAHGAIGNLGNGVFRADLYRQSSFNISQLGGTANPGSNIPGYTLVNLRAELNDINGTGVSIAAYVRNLFDKAYYTGGLATGNSAGINMANIGEPRMGGVEIKVKF
jgi:iron complex outermembrane receptor protein